MNAEIESEGWGVSENRFKDLDAFSSAIMKSRMLVEERLIAIAMLAGAETLTLEWPSPIRVPRYKRMLTGLSRRKQARAMSMALTIATALRDAPLEGE